MMKEGHGSDATAQVARAEAAELDETVAEDIRSIRDRHYDFEDAKMGAENPFDGKPDSHEYHSAWFHFENDLKTKTRFLGAAGEEPQRVFQALNGSRR